MGSRQEPGDVGAIDARRVKLAVTTELRDGRVGLGLSQATVAASAGLTRAQVGRVERGEVDQPDLEALCRIARVLGLRLSLKLYPEGSPVRDRAHLALLARLEARLAAPLHMRREVPLREAADQRAWDGWIEGGGAAFGTEGETHLLDIQAVTRRTTLKVRDDPRVGGVILVVARGAHNREVLRKHRGALRDAFPLDGREILAALEAGRVPSASGIVVI